MLLFVLDSELVFFRQVSSLYPCICTGILSGRGERNVAGNQGGIFDGNDTDVHIDGWGFQFRPPESAHGCLSSTGNGRAHSGLDVLGPFQRTDDEARLGLFGEGNTITVPVHVQEPSNKDCYSDSQPMDSACIVGLSSCRYDLWRFKAGLFG